MKRILISLLLVVAVGSGVAAEVAQDVSVTAALRDGSMIKGRLLTPRITGSALFADNLNLDPSIVRSVSFAGADAQASVALTNGDSFAMQVATAGFELDSALGKLDVPRDRIRGLTFAPGRSGALDAEGGLIFHCTFDSQEDVLHPAVGPAGQFFKGTFVPGKRDLAMLISPLDFGAAFDLPENFIGKSGCIEFWAKIASTIPVTRDGGDPRLFNISLTGFDDPHRSLWFGIDIGANDGGGNSGISANTYFGRMASQTGFTSGKPFADVIPGDWRGWHHYAVVWDADLVRLQDGTACPAVLLVDGKPVARRYAQSAGPDKTELDSIIARPKTLAFTWNPRHETRHCTKSPFFIDEFRIWNYAKTDFDLN